MLIAPEDLHQALQLLLERSMRLGHRRLAIRRYLMMCSQGYSVPALEQSFCEDMMDECTQSDLNRIRSSVKSWADMLEMNKSRTLSCSMK